MQRDGPLLGLIPAAGRATRLQGVVGSKELQAVRPPGEGLEPVPVAGYLLRAMAEAGVERAYLVLRAGKWDIPAHFALAPPPLGLPLAYVVTPGTSSIPATLDVAYPYVRGATVVTGFPDSCFAPLDAVGRAVERHRSGRAAVTLALFPSGRPDKTDMVQVEGERVVGLRVKPGPCGLDYTLGAAIWGPDFTEFLHGFLTRPEKTPADRELQISQVMAAALAAGLEIDCEPSPLGRYVDVGTPEDLARMREAGIGS